MAEFLTTKKTVGMIEEIICNAHSKLVLISPYWQLSHSLIDRIGDAVKRNTSITIIFGKTGKLEALEGLFLMKNISIRYLENLHAKCYFNQDSMVISSMNMYEFSENNREMGIYIKRDTDRQLFEAAQKEADHFLQHAVPVSQPKPKYAVNTNIPSIKAYLKPNASCIRCGTNIKYDPTKPLCKNCYSSWSEWEDEYYKEKYCHSCGNKADTSMAYPECKGCYKSNSRMIS